MVVDEVFRNYNEEVDKLGIAHLLLGIIPIQNAQ